MLKSLCLQSTSSELNAGDTIRQAEINAAAEQTACQEFSIDELREIAYHFGVPHLAQMTERETLVESIRRRI